MPKLTQVQVDAFPLHRFEPILGAQRAARFKAIARAASALLEGRAVVNVNSTAVGGGVAEMLQTLLSYLRGAGIDARWTVIAGDPEFFSVTKRIHNGIHGSPGDDGPLGAAEHEIYRRTIEANAAELEASVGKGDLVLLHDPQTAGLVEPLKRAGAIVVWRSHIGIDRPNRWSERAWEFVRPYVSDADAYVFSRESYAPPWLDRSRLWIIPPSIDPLAPKNARMTRATAAEVLAFVGILGAPATGSSPPVRFKRRDGSSGRLARRADVVQAAPPSPDVPLVVQVSRWDRLKDMQGVMESFTRHVARGTDAHLVLVGPNVRGVTDDPEGAQVLEECIDRWHGLSPGERRRVHLACIPTEDVDENAVIINAIQRHATVVTQKSLAEGFGLTVTEAMWKHRPVVASRVGGIGDQIDHDRNGVLVDDPTDLGVFGSAVARLVDDPRGARRMGAKARIRARDFFLGDRHLAQYAELATSLIERDGRNPRHPRSRNEEL